MTRRIGVGAASARAPPSAGAPVQVGSGRKPGCNPWPPFDRVPVGPWRVCIRGRRSRSRPAQRSRRTQHALAAASQRSADMVCFILALAGARPIHLNGREVQVGRGRRSYGPQTVIRAFAGEPLYLDQVSNGIGFPVRDLESAFRVNFGTSASGLLNWRRLDLVRAAIVSAEKSTVSIRAIAIEHGFWDLRGFEWAYEPASASCRPTP